MTGGASAVQQAVEPTLGNIFTLQDDQSKVTFLNCLTGTKVGEL